MKHRSRTPKMRLDGPAYQAGPSAAEIDGAVALFESRQWRWLEALAGNLVARYPGHAFGWHIMSLALEARGALPEAVDAASRAVKLAPQDAGMHRVLGNIFLTAGQFEAAEASYLRSIKIAPAHADTYNNLGFSLGKLDRLNEAEAACRKALEIEPAHAGAHKNLGNVLKNLGQFVEAGVCYRRALEIDPECAEARSNLLFSMLYDTGTAQQYTREAAEYGRVATAKVTARRAAWICPEPPERLRVGIVSGDLCRHPVGYFLEGVLSGLDKTRIELIAYPTILKDDDLSTRLRQHFARWQPLAGLGDEAAAKLIHGDGIHVLLDLSGHTAHNRLPVFAWKPAPVQATWLGYSASTGLAEMDYLIADPHVAPPEEEGQFTEKIWRLPDTYLCLTPEEAVDIGPPPALTAGIVTFGSFNNLSKMNDATVALWSKILHTVPASRLLLKASQLRTPEVRGATAQRFATCGIGPERLLLEGTVPKRADHLAAYNRMDIALDPFPYAGATTSAEALWMGVPFLTRRGDRFVSHVGESIARNAGLSDWIAADEDEYVAKAAAFASDLEELAGLRAGLREQVLASPLFDAPRFARNLEDALWGMWRQAGRSSNKASCLT